MQNTTNLNLNKPEESEKIDLELLNQNMDIIDQSIKNISDNFDNVEMELNGHIRNTQNPHEVTKSQLGLEKVENKSSFDIINELTKEKIIEKFGQNLYSAEEIDGKIIDSKNELETEIEILTHDIANISESIDTLDLNTLKKNDIETDTYIQELVRDIPGNPDNPLSELEVQTMIDTSFTENLSDVKIAQDAEGKWGYIPPGADAVIPFKANSGNNGIMSPLIINLEFSGTNASTGGLDLKTNFPIQKINKLILKSLILTARNTYASATSKSFNLNIYGKNISDTSDSIIKQYTVTAKANSTSNTSITVVDEEIDVTNYDLITYCDLYSRSSSGTVGGVYYNLKAEFELYFS